MYHILTHEFAVARQRAEQAGRRRAGRCHLARSRVAALVHARVGRLSACAALVHARVGRLGSMSL